MEYRGLSTNRNWIQGTTDFACMLIERVRVDKDYNWKISNIDNTNSAFQFISFWFQLEIVVWSSFVYFIRKCDGEMNLKGYDKKWPRTFNHWSVSEIVQLEIKSVFFVWFGNFIADRWNDQMWKFLNFIFINLR
jgi:hypothetical protein